VFVFISLRLLGVKGDRWELAARKHSGDVVWSR
jgi:hypothetical protein